MEILDRGKEVSIGYLRQRPDERVYGFRLCALFLTRFHESLSVPEFATLLDAGCFIDSLQVLYLYNPLLVRFLVKTGRMDVDEVIFDFCNSHPEPGKSVQYIETLRVLLSELDGKLEFFGGEGLRVREVLLRNKFTRGVFYEFMRKRKKRVILYEDEGGGI